MGCWRGLGWRGNARAGEALFRTSECGRPWGRADGRTLAINAAHDALFIMSEDGHARRRSAVVSHLRARDQAHAQFRPSP